ncbi:hypothetical protein DFP72DRAFT_882950 [Ephemerocybe angulata]|uniref:Uncharacterized protein n=1 Tax=Ephemerocybe angulata TaxID=980116 RepID=A0A8H6I6U5_9AGAR|nr:hypothetical protein DFP72DRAFT_882950 [Tulosesus angulatus]
MQTAIIRPSSSIRRKPSATYKSPTAEEWSTFAPCPSVHRASSSSQTPPPRPPRLQTSGDALSKKTSSKISCKTPLLPLYHPLGQLALSLPPLDPASFGLHLPPLNYNDPETSRSSSRARRRSAVPQVAEPAAEPIDIQAPAAPIASTVSVVAAVAAHEIKERASPRKRRTGGGGGGKRKRRDNESTDTSYPAKRTRVPRATTTAVVEEESHTEVEAISPDDPEENELDDAKAVERRTTRSRAVLKRQNSTASASETPSKSISPGAPDVPLDSTGHHDIEMKAASPAPDPPRVQAPAPEPEPPQTAAPNIEEKEEGELSDDGA